MNWHTIASIAFGFFVTPLIIGVLTLAITCIILITQIPEDFNLNTVHAWTGFGLLVVVIAVLLIALIQKFGV